MRTSHPDRSSLSLSLWDGLVPNLILLTAASYSWQRDAGVGRLRRLQPHQSYGTKLGAEKNKRLRGWHCQSLVLGISANTCSVSMPVCSCSAPVLVLSGFFISPLSPSCSIQVLPGAVPFCRAPVLVGLLSGQLLAVPASSVWQGVAPQRLCGVEPCPQPV